MAARFAEGGLGTKHRADELRERALELAEIELEAYAPVLEALRLPRNDPERAARIDAARTEASQSPLEVARIAAEVAELAAELASAGNPNLTGDAIAGALLAEASAQASARLVAFNLIDGPMVDQAAELARQARAARERALA